MQQTMTEQSDKIQEMTNTIQQLQQENQILKQSKVVQSSVVSQFEDPNSDISQKFKRLEQENRILREILSSSNGKKS